MRLSVSLIISALPTTIVIGFIYSRFISLYYATPGTLYTIERYYQAPDTNNIMDYPSVTPINWTISGLVTLRVNDYHFTNGNAPLSPYIPPRIV